MTPGAPSLAPIRAKAPKIRNFFLSPGKGVAFLEKWGYNIPSGREGYPKIKVLGILFAPAAAGPAWDAASPR